MLTTRMILNIVVCGRGSPLSATCHLYINLLNLLAQHIPLPRKLRPQRRTYRRPDSADTFHPPQGQLLRQLPTKNHAKFHQSTKNVYSRIPSSEATMHHRSEPSTVIQMSQAPSYLINQLFSRGKRRNEHCHVGIYLRFRDRGQLSGF